MADMTTELARESWRTYFDSLSHELGAVEATVEVDGDDLGAQILADRLLLTGLSYDDRDDVFVVELEAPGADKEDAEHLVYNPQRIFIDTQVGVTPSAIDVEDSEAHRTLVQLRPVPALGAE